MKIALATVGSRGDIQPYIALAAALNKKGHQTFVATHPYAKNLVESYSVRHEPVGRDIDIDTEVNKVLQQSKTPTKGLYPAIRFIISNLKNCHDDFMRLFPKVDLIIAGHSLAGLAEADILRKPYVRIAIDESGIPMIRPKLMSKQFFRGFVASFWASAFLEPYRKFRKEINAPPMDQNHDHPNLTLFPVSPAIYKKNDLWRPSTYITGYFFSDMPVDFIPDKQLINFLEHGDKPVFISLGSMHHMGQQIQKFFNTFREAIYLAHERVIIIMSGIQSKNVPDNILLAENIPYPWLLKRVSLVIHHFGFGTTAEVLKAGLPSIPIPHIFDHFKLARKIHRSGLAYKPLNIHKLTVRQLADAMKKTREDNRMKERIAAVSQLIIKENGLQKAVELIEQYFGNE